MSFIRKALRGTVYVAIGNFGSQFLAILVQLLMIRLLSPEIYGKYATVNVIVEIAYTIAVVEFSTACVYDIDREETFHSAVFMAIGWTIALALCFISIGFFISRYIDKSLWDIASVLIISKTIYGIGAVYGTYVERDFKFAGLSFMRLFSKAFGLGIGLLAAHLGYGIYSLLVVDVLNYLITTVLIIYFSTLKISWEKFQIKAAKNILHQGFKQFQFRLSGVVLYRSPILVAQALGGSSSIIGYIDRAMYLAQILNTFATSFTSKIALLLFRKIGKKSDDLTRLLEFMIWLFSRAFIPVAAIYLFQSNSLLKHLYGNEWLPAAPYLSGLAIFSFLLVNYNLLNQFYMALDKVEIVTRIQWTMVVCFVALSYSLNSLDIGFEVLSWIWSFLFIVATFFLLWKRNHKSVLPRATKEMLLPLVLLGICSLWFFPLSEERSVLSYILVYSICLIIVMIYDKRCNQDYTSMIFNKAKELLPRLTRNFSFY